MQSEAVARAFASPEEGDKKSTRYEPTPEDVRACWDHFSKLYGTKIIDKHDARLMKFIALFLSIGKGMTKDDFLDRYVTTVGKGIYVPFEPGVPNPDGSWSLWSQMMTCVHEHCHVDQYNASDTKNNFDFSRQYLLKKRRRTRFEVEAYSTNLALHHWRYGRTRKVDGVIRSLGAYRVGELDLDVARQSFEANNAMIEAGAVLTPATAEFFRWMESRGVLRHP